jgi:glycosyltransferase involved in cell wall biosynthesis
MDCLITIPVFNGEALLRNSVLMLEEYCRLHLDCQWRIVVVDNGSTDQTLDIAQSDYVATHRLWTHGNRDCGSDYEGSGNSISWQ